MKKFLAIVAIAITVANCTTPQPTTTPSGTDSTSASGTMGTGTTGTTDTTRQMP